MQPGVVAQVHPQVGGDLVVAAPPGSQLAAQRARAARAARAPGRCARPRRRRSGRNVRRGGGPIQVIQRGQHRGRARRRSSSPARCSTRACAREARRSYWASRQSNWTLTDSRASASAGPPANRPPHSRTAPPWLLFSSVHALVDTPALLRSRSRHPRASHASAVVGRPQCASVTGSTSSLVLRDRLGHRRSASRGKAFGHRGRRRRLAGDDQDGVVAGHGAEDGRQGRVVNDRGQELRRPGRGAQHDQVGAGLAPWPAAPPGSGSAGRRVRIRRPARDARAVWVHRPARDARAVWVAACAGREGGLGAPESWSAPGSPAGPAPSAGPPAPTGASRPPAPPGRPPPGDEPGPPGSSGSA